MYQSSLRFLAIIALSLGAIALIIDTAIDNPYFHNIAKQVIHQYSDRYINGTIQFQALSVQFLPPGVDVYGLSVVDLAQEDIISISRLEARMSPLSALFGRLRFSYVGLSELRVNQPKLSTLLKEDSSSEEVKVSWPPDFDLPVETVNISDATVQVQVGSDQQGTPELSVNTLGLDATLDFNDWDDWDGKIIANRSDLYTGKDHIVKGGRLELELSGREEFIKIDRLSIKSKRIDLSGNGKVDLNTDQEPKGLLGTPNSKVSELQGLQLDTKFDIVKADVAVLGDFLGTADNSGDVYGKAELKLDLSLPSANFSWSLTGSIKSRSGVLDGFKLLKSQLDFTVVEDRIYFDRVFFREHETTLAFGNGYLGFKKGTPFRFSIFPKDLSLTTLLKSLKVEDYKAVEAKLSSDEIVLKGLGKPFRMNLKGRGILRDLTFPAIKKPYKYQPPNCLLEANFDISKVGVHIMNNELLCDHDIKKIGKAASHIKSETEDDEDNEGDDITSGQIDGTIYFKQDKGLNLDFESRVFDSSLVSHFIQIPVEGMIYTKAKIYGGYDNLRALLNAHGESVTAYGFPGEGFSLTGEFDVQANRFFIKRLFLSELGGGQAILEDGYLDPSTLILDGSLDVESLSSSFLTPGIKEMSPASKVKFGIKKMRGRVHLPLIQPAKWKGEVYLNLDEGYYAGQKYFDRLEMNISADSKTSKTEDAYIRLALFEADIDFHESRQRRKISSGDYWSSLGLNLYNPISLKIKSRREGFKKNTHKSFDSVNHLASLPYLGEKLSALKIGADSSLNASIAGTYKHPKGDFEIVLDRVVLLNSALAPVQIIGSIDGGKIDIPVITHSGKSLFGKLSLDLFQPGIPYDWSLNLDQFDGRAILSHLFSSDPRNYLYISAYWQMSGLLNQWWDSKGSLKLSRLEGQYVTDVNSHNQRLQIFLDKEILLDIGDGSWAFENRKKMSIYGQSFEVSLGLENNILPSHMNASLVGRFDLSLFKKIIPEIDLAEGVLEFNGKLYGSLDDPKLDIDLYNVAKDPNSSDKINLGIVGFAPIFSDISVDMKLTEKSLSINKIEGKKGGRGRFRVNGTLASKGLSDNKTRVFVNFSGFEMSRVSIPVFNSAKTRLSGDLIISGEKLPYKVNGNVVIDEASSATDFDLRKEILSRVQQSRLKVVKQSRQPWFDLDIGVKSDKSITIKNRSVDVVMGADMTVRGTEEKPIFLGQIETHSGKFKYRRDFNLTRGVVSFEDPQYPPDPRLDIIGQSEVIAEGTSYIIQVAINGRASDPKVAISVDPPLKPDGSSFTKIDMLVLLTSGRLPSNTSSQASSGVLENEALSLVVGYAEGPLESIFDLTGQQYIRQVYLDTYLPQSEDGSSQPVARLNLPIRITDDLSLILQLDYAENMKASFQYSIDPKITLSGSVDSKKEKETSSSNLPADTAVDLKFKFKFE